MDGEVKALAEKEISSIEQYYKSSLLAMQRREFYDLHAFMHTHAYIHAHFKIHLYFSCSA